MCALAEMLQEDPWVPFCSCFLLPDLEQTTSFLCASVFPPVKSGPKSRVETGRDNIYSTCPDYLLEFLGDPRELLTFQRTQITRQAAHAAGAEVTVWGGRSLEESLPKR